MAHHTARHLAKGARPCLGYDESSYTTNDAKEGGHDRNC